MKEYLVLFITGKYTDKKLRVTTHICWENHQLVWVNGDRARILETTR